MRSGNSERWYNLAGEVSSEGREQQFNSHWVATGPCQRREQVCQVSSLGLSCKKKMISVQSVANLLIYSVTSVFCAHWSNHGHLKAELQLCSSSLRWSIIINGECERSWNDGAAWLGLLDLEFAMGGWNCDLSLSFGGFWCERYGTKEKQIMKETLKKGSKK